MKSSKKCNQLVSFGLYLSDSARLRRARRTVLIRKGTRSARARCARPRCRASERVSLIFSRFSKWNALLRANGNPLTTIKKSHWKSDLKIAILKREFWNGNRSHFSALRAIDFRPMFALRAIIFYLKNPLFCILVRTPLYNRCVSFSFSTSFTRFENHFSLPPAPPKQGHLLRSGLQVAHVSDGSPTLFGGAGASPTKIPLAVHPYQWIRVVW